MKIKFKGKLISLMTKSVVLPNGYKIRLEIIKHPGASLIIPMLDRNRVILIRQYRPVINRYLYELPAGTLDKNERPLPCAKRELIEETGYRGSKFTKLGFIDTVPGYSTEVIHIYKAENLQKVERNPEADEVIEIVIATRKKVQKMFKTRKITDSKTICAFAFIGWL